MEASLLLWAPGFLQHSCWVPPQATALDPSPYYQEEGTYLGSWLS